MTDEISSSEPEIPSSPGKRRRVIQRYRSDLSPARDFDESYSSSSYQISPAENRRRWYKDVNLLEKQ